MRFALMEAKMALIEIMKKYTFLRAPETEVSFMRSCICYTRPLIQWHTVEHSYTVCSRHNLVPDPASTWT